MGVIGPATLLQALARDHLIPGLSILGTGSKDNDEPHFAILITFIIAQVTMLFDINQIASFVTMSFLMTFLVTNLACFLLKIGSAPNFRPSFRYFTWESAATGAILSCSIMFFVDKVYASACVALLIAVFVIIHYTSPPKSWGDVSQTLIYHQVRKYLLRLRQDHVKFWRPSVLLFVNDPRKKYKLIQFCNSLKKGALFILGHVIITDDFKAATPEVKRQQSSWSRYIDVMKIKAFINIAVSPTVDWGLRNVVLNSGLGGMRPNIVIMGFFNLSDLRKREPLVDVPDLRREPSDQDTPTRGLSSWLPSSKRLPTDSNRKEAAIDAKSYVTTLEDLVYSIRINVAVAKGFESLELPTPAPNLSQRLRNLFGHRPDTPKKYIDLWPIQMSTYSQIREDGKQKRGVLATNFDTYTMILQLGAILTTVNSYQRSYSLRVSVFVEYEIDVEEERKRILSLLANLRIKAEVRVFWLANGDVSTYEVIVNGKTTGEFAQASKLVDDVLRDEPWWEEVEDLRREESSALHDLSQLDNSPSLDWRRESFRLPRPQELSEISVKAVKRMLKRGKRASMGRLKSFHPEMRVQLSRLDPNLIAHNHAYDSPSESSSSDSGESTDEEAGIGSESGSRGRVGSPSASRLQRIQKSMSSKSMSTAEPLLAHFKARILDSIAGASSGSGTATPRGLGSPRKPPAIRHQSMPKFTSRPMPRTKIAAEEREGGSNSIMFDEPATVDANEGASADSDSDEAQTLAASGFPQQQSLALSFNDLPARAQHLVLNELMVASSADAGVVFTTLPGPAEGTGASEADSVRYLSDLEVLCAGLPPVLLVHSNAVTVTVSL
jgi:potassium/chloride transporter 9